jgi:hypothetical protein
LKSNIQGFRSAGRLVLPIVLLSLLPSCEYNPKVVIEYGVPPRFQVSGPGTLKYFVISGPDLKRDAANRQGDGDYLQLRNDYWKLIPSETARYQSLDEIGSIVYGQVPAGLIQVLPEHGPPPPLVEGDLYNVHLEPNDSYSFNTFFSIRDGKVLAVTQK